MSKKQDRCVEDHCGKDDDRGWNIMVGKIKNGVRKIIGKDHDRTVEKHCGVD